VSERQAGTGGVRFIVGDPLRALAVMGVLVYHAGNPIMVAHGYAPGPTFGSAGVRTLLTLQQAVYLFFALSGYLLARPFIAGFTGDGQLLPDTSSYLRRRLLRIVPCFWLVAAITLVRHGTSGASPLDVAAIFGFVQTIHEQPVDGPIIHAWTLDAEMLFYLLLPLVAVALVVGLRRMARGPARFAVVMGLLGLGFGVSFAHYLTLNPLVHQRPEPFDVLWAFVPGVALAAIEVLIGERLRAWRAGPSLAVALVLLGLALLVRGATLADVQHEHAREVLGSLGFAALVAGPLLLQWTSGGTWRLLDNRVLHWIGERSYSIFLVHLGVIAEFGAVYRGGHGPWMTFGIVLAAAGAISLAASHFLYLFVERPFVRLAHRQRPLRAAVSLPVEPAELAPAVAPEVT
jgi:peptidoglycan/LPS O-acetylase OafA/YrhL